MTDIDKKKRGGRPKSQAGDAPLIFARLRSRVRKEVVMQAHLSQELDRYVKWASRAADPPISEEDALSLLVSTAVEDLLRRDTLWSKVKADQTRDEKGDDEDEEDPSASAPVTRASDAGRGTSPAPSLMSGLPRNGSSLGIPGGREP